MREWSWKEYFFPVRMTWVSLPEPGADNKQREARIIRFDTKQHRRIRDRIGGEYGLPGDCETEKSETKSYVAMSHYIRLFNILHFFRTPGKIRFICSVRILPIMSLGILRFFPVAPHHKNPANRAAAPTNIGDSRQRPTHLIISKHGWLPNA